MSGIRAFTTASVIAGALSAVGLAPACGTDPGPKDSSQTHFLSACQTNCASGLTCVCGVCSKSCSTATECAPLVPGAQCVPVATRNSGATCPSATSVAFCDLPCGRDADCAALGSAFRCQSGYCRVPGDGGAASACPATTLAVGDNSLTVTVGATTRSYLAHLPANYAGTGPVPLVLDFHPLSGTPQLAADSSGFRDLGEQEGFIVAWPLGIDLAWNIGPCCTTSRDVDDVGFARAVVQQLQNSACIDVKRVYAVGVAMGGGMAYELGCNAADVFAGIAPSAFDLLVESEQPCQPTRPLAEISFRGTADTLVPYDGGTVQPPNGLNVTMTLLGAVGTLQRWAELDQCTGSPSAADSNGCQTYSNCAGGVEVTLCTTQGGGMAWGSPAISWPVLQRHPMP
jgi:polyhydroxybutyrate depolymerase